MYKFRSFYIPSFSRFLFGILLLSLNGYASNTKKEADFLVIEDPSVYTFLNEFEQPATESEKKSFKPYSPLQIVSSGEQLGDQITSAARFIYSGKTCFILTDEKFKKIKRKATWEKVYRRCTVINDTVKARKTITLSVKEPAGPQAFTVTKGSLLLRVFKCNAQWYCIPLTGNGQFGWYQGSTDAFDITQKQKSSSIEIGGISDFSEKIYQRLKDANAQYDTFFTYFNTKTTQNKSVPQWIMTIDGNTIHCILKGSPAIDKFLEKSTRYIVSDLEHILLGKQYQALYTHGEVIIRRRTP